MSELTAEQIVKQKWPDAYVRKTPTGLRIQISAYLETYGFINTVGLSKRLPTEADAWADAAKRLRSKRNARN